VREEMRLTVPMPVICLELPSAETIEGAKDMWKVEKTIDLLIMWVDAPESVIQNESDELAKQEIPGCVKVALSKVETEYIFWIRESYSDFGGVIYSSAKVRRVLESYAVDDPVIPDK